MSTSACCRCGTVLGAGYKGIWWQKVPGAIETSDGARPGNLCGLCHDKWLMQGCTNCDRPRAQPRDGFADKIGCNTEFHVFCLPLTHSG